MSSIHPWPNLFAQADEEGNRTVVSLVVCGVVILVSLIMLLNGVFIGYQEIHLKRRNATGIPRQAWAGGGILGVIAGLVMIGIFNGFLIALAATGVTVVAAFAMSMIAARGME